METVSGNGVGERFLNSEAEASVGNHRLRSRINRRLPKGNSVKVALAAGLRAETTMTVGWIAERLTMGTCGYLNHLVYRQRKLGGE